MRTTPWILLGFLAAAPIASSWAVEGDGLTPGGRSVQWPQWQGRVSLGMSAAGPRADAFNRDSPTLTGASLLGDYYFSRFDRGAIAGGGFRATSGVFVGTRSSLLAFSPLSAGRGFNIERRSLSSFALAPNPDNNNDSAVPYLGLGYTGLYGKSGWGFSADIGVMALVGGGSAVKLGRVFTGNQSLDDALHEMRLSPLLQVGVSYSF